MRDLQNPDCGGVGRGAAALEAGAPALSFGPCDRWFPEVNAAANAKIRMPMTTHMATRNRGTGTTAAAIIGVVTREVARRGRSAIRRAAIVLKSRFPRAPSGSAASNDSRRRVADAAGNLANLAASCQGSSSSRASADRTLSNIPLPSSPIGANRKLSNSVPRNAGDAVRVISAKEFRYFGRAALQFELMLGNL